MADEKPKLVSVEALQDHTYNGQSYKVGDTYDIDEQYIETLRVQGKAVRADRIAQAKAAEKVADKKAADQKAADHKAGAKTRGQSAKVLTTDDLPTRQPILGRPKK